MKRLLRALFGPSGQPKAGDAELTISKIVGLVNSEGIANEVVNFGHIPGGEVVFGAGALRCIGEKAKALGAKRVLVITDPGLRAAGHEEKTLGFLRKAGLEAIVFDEVRENPTTKDVGNAVRVAQDESIDLIVGLGGGSSMDTAKGCNFILTNGGHMRNYWGVGKASQPMLPMIAVPTTSGTGSECQSFALIADEETHMKMACGDKKAAAAVAILDPELTLTQPTSVTAHTGIDAIAHAVETAVCNKRSKSSSAYSRLAFLLLNAGLERVLDRPDDIEARSMMQLGAAYAGTAIENSMLGAAHSSANPLTANFGVIHGQAVGTMLPHVIRWNQQDPEIAEVYTTLCPGLDARVETLLAKCGMDKSIGDLGGTRDSITKLSTEAAAQWTAQFNPVPVDAAAFTQIYEKAF